jgi:hypothetical protein
MEKATRKRVDRGDQSQIDAGVYAPKAPPTPIPPGVTDCFGKYNDPHVDTCSLYCYEFETCAFKVSLVKHLTPRGR